MSDRKYLKWSNTTVSDAEIKKNLDIFDQWYSNS